MHPRGKYYDEYGRTRMWGTAPEVGSIAVLMATAEREQRIEERASRKAKHRLLQPYEYCHIHGPSLLK